MSRHAAIDSLSICAPPSAVSADWTIFVTSSGKARSSSPIDSFYVEHQGLNKLGSLLQGDQVDEDVQYLLGGQLLLGYVSATELYFRQMISRCVALCPIIRQANGQQMIPFGALDYYHKDSLENALTERVSFSEPGTIKNQLDGRLGVKVVPRSSLDRSIEDYEKLCQVRHSLVHSHGVVNSSNAAKLGIDPARSLQTCIDSRCLQLVAAVALNLVRDANNEIARSIVWDWVKRGILTGDNRKDRAHLGRLLRQLGSAIDSDSGRSVTGNSELFKIVKAAVVAISTKSIGRRR
ncbi:hypothetical protein EV193_102817 [Herbihabitans rhizosphaerae]|uniref:Uncharacterized protein n=1 Tax=Herbihabitans rhizosphaerae TaxID=1872711 RepID=A0A4Q7L3V4_9PSEU|nr:hypothetical protein EV193_102817 [Herbihabitans rhizosphaerae]